MGRFRGLIFLGGLLALLSADNAVHSPPALAVPPNDNFADAISITTPTVSGIVTTGNTVGATTETGEPTSFGAIAECNGQATGTYGATVWYNWTAPETKTYVFDTYGSDIESVLAVYTGNAVNGLTLVKCSRDFPTNATGNDSAFDLAATAGATYRLQLGTVGSGANFVLNMSLGAEMFVTAVVGDTNFANGFLVLREAMLLARGGTGPSGLNRAPESGESSAILNLAAAGLSSSDVVHFSGGLPSLTTIASALPQLDGMDVVSGIGRGGMTIDGAAFDCFTMSGNSNRIEALTIFGCLRGIIVAGDDNVVGGTTIPAQRNHFRSNLIGIRIEGGASGNKVIGNTIGVPDNGTASLANDTGVLIVGNNNTIGGSAPGEGNQITGATGEGTVELVYILGNSNKVYGNRIGTTADGTAQQTIYASYSSMYGVRLDAGAANNEIGGAGAGEGNVISSSGSIGVELGNGSTGNLVRGNKIGTDITGTSALPNSVGVSIVNSASNIVGGIAAGQGNRIAFNTGAGVRVDGASSTGNAIRGNAIHSNGGPGIDNLNGGNGEPGHVPPVVKAAGSARGTACPNCIVDVFSDSANEGQVYQGSVVSDSAGYWSFVGSVTGPNATATATTFSGSTTEFSAPLDATIPDQFGPTYSVDSADPGDDGRCQVPPGDCKIREAMNSANDDGVASTVVLGNGQTYLLTAGALPVVSTDITIDGNGSTIQRSGGTQFRIFHVNGSGALTLQDLTANGGRTPDLLLFATRNGGGILVEAGGAAHLFNTTVSGNATGNGTSSPLTAGADGGGIYVAGTLTLTDSTVSGNTTGNGGNQTGCCTNAPNGGSGGGVYAANGSSVTVTRSTISGNTTGNGGNNTGPFNNGGQGGSGAGLYIDSTSVATISNSTIANNTPGGGGNGPNDGAGGSGGGIHNQSTSLTLTNVTLSGNAVGGPSAGSAVLGTGGNIRTFAAILAKNTIVSGPVSGANCTGTAFNASSATNLASDASCTPGFTQKTTGEINLGPLANNGGPTQTMALLAGSHAIDTGDAATCAAAPVSGLDQRGALRPLDGDGAGAVVCDIGAFEACPPSPDCDGDGFTDAAEGSIGTRSLYPCGSSGWPADLAGNDNRLTIGDINSFLFPLRLNGTFNKFDHPVPDPQDANIGRWNLSPDATINIGDLNALNPAVVAPTSRPPMFGGQAAFFTDVGNGVGGCPFPP